MIKNLHFNRSLTRILATLAFAIFMLTPGWGQLFESFETGLPTSYNTTLSNVTLASGIWQIDDVIAGSIGVQSGTTSAQVRGATGAQMITPSLTGGVATISFYVTASTASGAYQVNVSTDGGSTWSAAPGSPFTINTTKTFRSITVNNASVNKVQFYRTAATIYFDDITITAFTSPLITVTGSLLAFSTTTGTPSATQNYTVAGTNLSADIVITPPAGFQVSLAETSGYANSLTLTQASGSVATTTIFVRLTGAAAGSFSGNITHVSTGASTVNQAVTGTVTAPAGPISIAALNTAYSENFNTLSSTGSSNVVPSAWAFAETGSGADLFYNISSGTSPAGDTYSYGAAGNTERAFGTLASSSLVSRIGAGYTNNTGGIINQLSIAYTGEQWRLYNGAIDRLDFQYSLDATSLTTGNWVDIDALDFNAPVTSGTTGALNGNVAPNRTAISNSITGINIANGATFWIRFVDPDVTGTDSGLGIDDWSLTASLSSTPALAVGALTGFGNVCINTTAGPNSFAISGINLTTTNVTVSSLPGFSYSTTAEGSYTSTLSLTQPGGTYSQQIFVKFTPTSVQSYDGNIVVGGGGAGNVNRSVTGSGINTTPTVTTTSPATNIAATTVTLSGNVTSEGCQGVTARGICYGESLNPDISGSKTTETGTTGAFSSNLTGLAPGTIYHFRAYATTSAGVSYGSDFTFTTLALDAPVATAATAVGSASFTANWGTVIGATGYLLDVYTQSAGTFTTDLIISEYSEGTSNNKYIEIYNGTGATVDLSQYTLKQAYGGGGWPSSDISLILPLSGSLAQNEVYVIASNQANTAILAQADLVIAYHATNQGGRVIYFDGNDAMGLFKNSSLIDLFGDPGSSANFDVAGITGAASNHTIVRKPTISAGNTNWASSAGTNVTNSEWIVYAVDTWTYLGTHTFNGAPVQTFVQDYQNLPVAGTSKVVNTNLSSNTTYYYVVRSTSSTSTSSNSNIVTTVTLPTISTTAISDLTLNSATSGGTIGVGGGAEISLRGVCWSINPNPTIAGSKTQDGTGTGAFTSSITGLDPNTTYHVRAYATNAGGTAYGEDVMFSTLTPAPDVTSFTGSGNWTDPGNWEPGVPGELSAVTIDGTGPATITTSVEVTNLTIYASRKLIIESTGSLTVTGILTNSAGNSGLVIKSGGSLISTSENVAATVERAIEANDWHLISSPMTNASSQLFQGHYLQRHTESTNKYTDLTLPYETLTAGKGFALWGDLPTASFTGNLNAIDVPIGTTSDYADVDPFNNKGWNLVGNPFASSIDWDAITKPDEINDAIYIHVDGSTWATYGGGVGVNAGGTKYIASCQGFFVRATANVTLTIPATSRVHNNTAFFKNSDESVPDLVRLEISGNGYNDESVVRLKPEATAEFDGKWDAYKLFGSVAEAPQIYTFGPTPLAINAFRELTTVPVGVRAGTSGTYTIAATEINDLQNVKLEDTKTGIITDLTSKSYTFEFTAGENESRFKLHFTALGVDEKETNHTNIYSYQQTVYVNLADNTEGNIYIYNLAGQLVTAKESASGSVRIGLTSTGVYMVKVVTQKETLTQKVVIR